MTDKPTGGPAYPQATQTFQDSMSGGRYVLTEQYGGMTLRDYFAGQALAGFCSNFNGSNMDPSWFEQHGAPNAYAVADAMIAARD